MERTNILNEFFNSKSDANKYLSAEIQEDIEREFQDFMINKGEVYAISFVEEMCIQSLSPALFEKWEKLRYFYSTKQR